MVEAGGLKGSIHLGSASYGSAEVLSRDEEPTSGDEEDVLDSGNEADISQGSMPLFNISIMHDEDTHKCKAHELTHKSDIDFAAWRDKAIHEGVVDIQEQDKQYMTILILVKSHQRTLTG